MEGTPTHQTSSDRFKNSESAHLEKHPSGVNRPAGTRAGGNEPLAVVTRRAVTGVSRRNPKGRDAMRLGELCY